MKFEYKVVVLSLIFSVVCMFMFTYTSSFDQKTFYVYQVGIYKDKKNKNNKMKELKEAGYESYEYQKNEQFYVLSMISEDHKIVKEHAQSVKGIMKKYIVSSSVTIPQLLEMLSKGEIHDS